MFERMNEITTSSEHKELHIETQNGTKHVININEILTKTHVNSKMDHLIKIQR